jgi:hypothetical protein
VSCSKFDNMSLYAYFSCYRNRDVPGKGTYTCADGTMKQTMSTQSSRGLIVFPAAVVIALVAFYACDRAKHCLNPQTTSPLCSAAKVCSDLASCLTARIKLSKLLLLKTHTLVGLYVSLCC